MFNSLKNGATLITRVPQNERITLPAFVPNPKSCKIHTVGK